MPKRRKKKVRKYSEEYILIIRDGSTHKKLFEEWDNDIRRLAEKLNKYISLKYK